MKGVIKGKVSEAKDVIPDPNSPTGYSRAQLDGQGHVVGYLPATAPASETRKTEDPAPLKERMAIIAGQQGKNIGEMNDAERATIRKAASDQLVKEAKTKQTTNEDRLATIIENLTGGAAGKTEFDALKPDPKTANKVDPKTGYTPNAI